MSETYGPSGFVYVVAIGMDVECDGKHKNGFVSSNY